VYEKVKSALTLSPNLTLPLGLVVILISIVSSFVSVSSLTNENTKEIDLLRHRQELYDRDIKQIASDVSEIKGMIKGERWSE